MQSMTPTLLAAQKKPRGKPVFKVEVSDHLGPMARYTWTQLYTDAQDDQPHCMAICSDNSIIRVCSDSGTAKYQRITDPTAEAEWTTWTTTGSACSATMQMALATNGAHAWWFYISSNDMVLYCRESSDYGASWGAATTVHTCAGTYHLESVAVACRVDTDGIVFYSTGDSALANTTNLWRRKQTAGAWGTATAWGKTPATWIRGLTCYKLLDYCMLYGAMVDAYAFFGIGEGPGLSWLWTTYAIVYGDDVDVPADTWADPVLVERTDSGTSYATAWPSLTYVDTYRAIFTGYLEGEEYSRLLRMAAVYAPTFLETCWSDAWPFLPNAGPYGSVIAYDILPTGDGYVYVSHSNCAYRAPAATDGSVDLGDRLIKYRILDRWSGWKGSGVSEDYGQNVTADLDGEIWLDNHDGALNNLGTGDLAPVKRGSMVEISRGYRTSEGNEYLDWPDLWIEDWEYVADFKGKSYLVLYCTGGWGYLASMAAARQYQWEDDEATVWTIAERLFALAGFELSSEGEASSLIASHKPAIVINPGEDLRGACLKVLSKVPDFVYWSKGVPYVKELADDEASDYTYGGAGNHVIDAGRYGVRTPGYNHIEVFSTMNLYGIPVFGDEVDYDEINLVGHRLQKIFDYAYDTNSECDARAVAQLRKHDATKNRGMIETLPNLGLQLLDVVTITDTRAGVTSETYRVRGIEETFDSTKPPLIWRQRVALSAR
jgi:hypothetical protein